MLEETNDNLSQSNNESDGNLTTDVQTNNQVVTNLDAANEQTSELKNEDTEICEKQQALNEIEASNAEENEDETLKARHEIPMLDYDTLSMEVLVDELQKLVSNEKVMSIRDHVEEIKKAFLSKYNHFIEEKKEEFHTENPESTEEFQYHFPLKTKFDQFYTLYKDNKNTHFKSLQNNLKSNLDTRLTIVEELKELINPNENIKDTLKHFNE